MSKHCFNSGYTVEAQQPLLVSILSMFYCRFSYEFCRELLEPNLTMLDQTYMLATVFNFVILGAVEGLEMASQTDPKSGFLKLR